MISTIGIWIIIMSFVCGTIYSIIYWHEQQQKINKEVIEWQKAQQKINIYLLSKINKR